MKYFPILLALFLTLTLSTTFYGQSTTAPEMKMTQSEYKGFLQLFFDYPEQALKNNVEGTVVIDFVCDNHGQITKKYISKKVNPAIDSTAIALFDLLIWQALKTDDQSFVAAGFMNFKFNAKKFRKLAKQRGYLHTPPLFSPHDTTATILPVEKTHQKPIFAAKNEYKTLADYINNELNYPENAKKLGLDGTVTLSFVIELNGMPSNIHVENYVGGGCTEEAVRLTEAMRWTPAVLYGEYVRTLNKLNITFEKGNNKAKYIPNQSNTGI